MGQLIKGYVQNKPDFAYKGARNTPILKFKVQIGDNWFKRQEVVVFGDKAEANQDLERGEYVILGGDLKENTFGGETKLELVIGWKGNLKRCKDMPKVVNKPPTGVNDEDEAEDGVVSAPRSYRRRCADDDEPDFGVADLDDCPDFDFPDPTDEEFENFLWGWVEENEELLKLGGFIE